MPQGALIDVDDVLRVVSFLINKKLTNKSFNLSPSQAISPLWLAQGISKVLGIDPKINLINKGSAQNIDLGLIKLYLNEDDILFRGDYKDKVIEKYSLPVLDKIISEYELSS